MFWKSKKLKAGDSVYVYPYSSMAQVVSILGEREDYITKVLVKFEDVGKDDMRWVDKENIIKAEGNKDERYIYS